MKKYTENFFDRAIPILSKYLTEFKDKDNIKFMEIGSFEGRSTCWFLDNILTSNSSSIYCIDLWENSETMGSWAKDLYVKYKMKMVKENFFNNIKEYGNKVNIIEGISQIALRQLPLDSQFDFIYIDGSHIASDVLEDAILSFRLLKVNGILGFDDYIWDYFGDKRRHPKLAIDAFLAVFDGKYELLHKERQVFIKKIDQTNHII